MGEIGNLFNIIFTFPIYNALMVLYHLFGDFGLSIVVLTLIIKLCLFPLNLQQLKSMKANQALQPKMQELKKKYENDKQAQMVATQALYKEYGINPVAGCLPLLVQMPVLYGLYFAFNTVLRGAKTVQNVNQSLYPFVAHFTHYPDVSFRWFTWLSFLNPIFHLNWAWSFSLGNPDPSHVLPVIAGLATFVQIRMSQPKPVPGAVKPSTPDPTQQTMKMMQYIMPLFTFFIGLTFPAGLALYWTVSALFQAAQQFFVTGWGALLVKPNLTPRSSAATTIVNSNGTAQLSLAGPRPSRSERQRERTTARPIVDSNIVDADIIDDEETDLTEPGAITKNLNNPPRPAGSGPSQYTRRQRGGSSSARRRSSNTQKSRR